MFRGVLQGARRGLGQPFVKFRLITGALCYRHGKYQIVQAMPQYENIDMHAPISIHLAHPYFQLPAGQKQADMLVRIANYGIR